MRMGDRVYERLWGIRCMNVHMELSWTRVIECMHVHGLSSVCRYMEDKRVHGRWDVCGCNLTVR